MSDNGLTGFRERLDPIDEEIARLLGERFEICREVAAYKSEHGIPMMQPERVAEVRARYLARGAAVNLPEDFTAALFELLIGATCKLEDELMEGGAASEGQERGAPSCRPGPRSPAASNRRAGRGSRFPSSRSAGSATATPSPCACATSA